MQAAAHHSLKGMGGPSSEVAEEFLDKTPHDTKSKFASAYRKSGKGKRK